MEFKDICFGEPVSDSRTRINRNIMEFKEGRYNNTIVKKMELIET